MNAHHKLSFIASVMMLGTVLTPSAGYLLAAVVSGAFAISSVLLNGWYQRKRSPVLESTVVAIMASEAAKRETEIDQLKQDITGLKQDNADLKEILQTFRTYKP